MKKTPLYLAIASATLLAAGCTTNKEEQPADNTPEQELPDDSPPTNEQPTEKVGVINTASNLNTGSRTEPKSVYFDLDNNVVIDITDAEASTNTDWDVGFQRTQVFINRFADPAVSLYYTGNNNDFYTDDGATDLERFVNATAETEYDAFDTFSISMVPEGVSFETDSEVEATDGFYNYNFITHTVSANPESFFVVSSDEAYSKFNVIGLTQDGFGMTDITLSIAYQATGTMTFDDPIELVIDAAGCAEDLFIDLDTQQTVTDIDGWDLRIPCKDGLANFEIHLTDGATSFSGDSAIIDGVDAENASFYPWVSNVTTVLAIKEHGNPNSSYGWGEYGVNGGHLLWPNFSTYVIKTAVGSYKFQITNYYDTETSASGSYSFRFGLLTE